jgi:hypothetical protein
VPGAQAEAIASNRIMGMKASKLFFILHLRI